MARWTRAFGDLLRETRSAHNVSQRQLGAALNTSHVYISEIERGVRGPMSPARILAIAAFFGVMPERLLYAAVASREKVKVTVPKSDAAVRALVSLQLHSDKLSDREWAAILCIMTAPTVASCRL